MLLSNCAMFHSKKSKFLKEQEVKRLLSSLGTRMSLTQMFLISPRLF